MDCSADGENEDDEYKPIKRQRDHEEESDEDEDEETKLFQYLTKTPPLRKGYAYTVTEATEVNEFTCHSHWVYCHPTTIMPKYAVLAGRRWIVPHDEALKVLDYAYYLSCKGVYYHVYVPEAGACLGYK